MSRRWTPEEDRTLLDGIGVFSLQWFVRKLNRTPNAIWSRCYKLYGKGGLKRGVSSLNKLVLETGYDKQQLLRAQRALNQKWKKTGPRGHYLVSFEQTQEIITWLQHDYWNQKLRLYRCINCGSVSSPSRGMGLCNKCYFKIRRRLKKLNMPYTILGLRQWVLRVDGTRPGMRVLKECVKKGKSPTERVLDLIASWLN